MDIAKSEDWSSAGKTDLGIGLAGPVALDNGRISSLAAARGNAMDIDDDYGVRVAGRTPTKSVPRDSGFCICGKPFNKPEMVLCLSPVSQNMFFPLFSTPIIPVTGDVVM